MKENRKRRRAEGENRRERRKVGKKGVNKMKKRRERSRGKEEVKEKRNKHVRMKGACNSILIDKKIFFKEVSTYVHVHVYKQHGSWIFMTHCVM